MLSIYGKIILTIFIVMQVIEITSLNGHSPYDISICDITLTYCYVVATGVVSVPPTLQLPIPSQLEGANQVLVVVTDSIGCEEFLLETCPLPITAFCFDIGSEAIPPTSTTMSILGYYNGYAWFSGLFTSNSFSYYMIVYYDTVQEAWIGAQSPTPITPPGNVNTITTINTDVGIGVMPPETGWGFVVGYPYGSNTLFILGINYNDNSCLVTPTPTPTPTMVIVCNCISFENTTSGTLNFSLTQCNGTILNGMVQSGTTLYYCGRLPSADIGVNVQISEICIDNTCAPIPTATPTATPTPTLAPIVGYFQDSCDPLNTFIVYNIPTSYSPLSGVYYVQSSGYVGCVTSISPITSTNQYSYILLNSQPDINTCQILNPCPTPTPTSTPTSTPIPLEEFIINAVGVNQIYQTPSSGFTINSSLTYYIDWGDGIETFPPGITKINHIYSSPYTGQIKILSTNLTTITSFNSETNPHNSQSLWTTTSELQKLDGLLSLNVQNSNGLFITGDVNNLPTTLTSLIVYNNNLSGDTSNLPQFLTLMAIYGTNTISGDTSGFPSTLTSVLDLQGNNTVSGDTSNLPSMLTTSTMIIRGQNTISGDTSGLPAVRQLRITGNNTISGSVLNLPSSLVICEIDGFNTINGDISTVPPNIQIFLCDGNNTISGDITTLPLTSRSINIQGLNTITGDLFLLPPLITGLRINGSNNTFSYSSSGRIWASNYTGLFIQTTGGSWPGFNSTETDNLLNDIQPRYINTPVSNFTIKCGSIPKRTSASDSAYNALVTLIGSSDVILN